MRPGSLAGLTIHRIDTFAVRLPALRSFSPAGGAVTMAGAHAVRVHVKVTASDGSTVWGEATPIPSWTYETLESITTTIEGYLTPAVRGRPAWGLDGLGSAFERVISRGFTIGAPLAKAAVDVAVNDLLGRVLGVSLGTWWGRRRLDRIEASDLATFVKLHAVDVAIAKVQRSGGLTVSRRLCALAEDAGVRLIGSGLTESDLGLAASLHLFAAFGNVVRRPARDA